MIPASLPYTRMRSRTSTASRTPTRPSRSSTTPASRRRCRSRSGGRRRTTAPASGDEYAEIKRQLDERALRRDAEVDRVEPVLRGRVHRQVPDLPARLVPGLPGRGRLRRRTSMSNTSFLNIHYDNPEIDKLLADEKASTDRCHAPGGVRRRSSRSRREDAPNIPIWQGDQVAGGARRGQRGRGHLRPGVHLPLLADYEGLGGRSSTRSWRACGRDAARRSANVDA